MEARDTFRRQSHGHGLGRASPPISARRAATERLHDADRRSLRIRVLPTYEGASFSSENTAAAQIKRLGRRCAIISVSNLPGCIFEQCNCAVSLALELELDHPMNFAGVNFKAASVQGASCIASNGKSPSPAKNKKPAGRIGRRKPLQWQTCRRFLRQSDTSHSEVQQMRG